MSLYRVMYSEIKSSQQQKKNMFSKYFLSILSDKAHENNWKIESEVCPHCILSFIWKTAKALDLPIVSDPFEFSWNLTFSSI